MAKVAINAFIALVLVVTCHLGTYLDPGDQMVQSERCLLSAQIETGSAGEFVARSYAARSFREIEVWTVVGNTRDDTRSDIYCRYRGAELVSLMVDAEVIPLSASQE